MDCKVSSFHHHYGSAFLIELANHEGSMRTCMDVMGFAHKNNTRRLLPAFCVTESTSSCIHDVDDHPHLMANTEISNTRSAFGGILNPGCPEAPYAYCHGMLSRADSPSCMLATPSSQPGTTPPTPAWYSKGCGPEFAENRKPLGLCVDQMPVPLFPAPSER